MGDAADDIFLAQSLNDYDDNNTEKGITTMAVSLRRKTELDKRFPIHWMFGVLYGTDDLFDLGEFPYCCGISVLCGFDTSTRLSLDDLVYLFEKVEVAVKNAEEDRDIGGMILAAIPISQRTGEALPGYKKWRAALEKFGSKAISTGYNAIHKDHITELWMFRNNAN